MVKGNSMIFIRMYSEKCVLGLSLQANVWNISSCLLRYERIKIHCCAENTFYYTLNSLTLF